MPLACDSEITAAQLREIKDSYDSIHTRMDRFFSWAGLMQSELHNLRRRVGFIEGVLQDQFQFTESPKLDKDLSPADVAINDIKDDETLMTRLKRINQSHKA